jgi:hypothetical protein
MIGVTPLGILGLVLLLQVKHGICDGLLQTRWMLTEKGSYGKSGGLAHAGEHGAGSLAALLLYGLAPLSALAIAAADTVVHYHIDFGKEFLSRKFALTPRDTYFWWLLTADQALHHAFYLAIAAAVITLV